MAGMAATRSALSVLASNYGKPRDWCSDNEKLWLRNMTDVSDSDLLRGVETWCRSQPRLPNLARLRSVIESNPTRQAPVDPPGCPACDGTGHREVARWYEAKDKIRAETRLAACDCPSGERFAAGAFGRWMDVVKSWRNLPDTVRVFHGTAGKPHLQTNQRMTPDDFAEWSERAKSGEANSSGWKHVTGRR